MLIFQIYLVGKKMRTSKEKRENDKEIYNYYKRLKICIECHCKEAYKGKVLCLECIFKRREKEETYQQKKRRKKRQNKAAKKRYRERKSKGLCPRCNRKNESNKVYCVYCRSKHSKRYYTKREEHELNGLCRLCGKQPKVEGRNICNDCHKICKEKQKHMINLLKND